jgi:uncharacterized iron-regulated membrane protein
MTTKKIIRKIHLWLGLTSGLIVFIIAITGCIYAFEREIQSATQSFRYVEPQQAPYLQPTRIKEIAETNLPRKSLHSIMYGKPGEAVRITFYHLGEEYYYMMYVNPYSGQVLKTVNMNRDFFRIVLVGHFYLWLPPAIGQPITLVATGIFVVMMITGIILWWPRNKSAARQRFSIKWSAAWRRKNYDLHNVLGFYMTWVAIILAITGLAFGWQWLAKTVYHGVGGKKSLMFTESVSDTSSKALAAGNTVHNVDKLWVRMQQEHKEAETIEMHFAESDSSSLEVAINPDASTYWRSEYRFFDQYTLNEFKVDHIYGRFKDLTKADKMIRMNYDVHVGAIWGLPGKILAFFASLIAASLPITGFLIWWGRRKKKTKAQPAAAKPSRSLENIPS